MVQGYEKDERSITFDGQGNMERMSEDKKKGLQRLR